MKFGEALRAVAALQQERLAGGDIGEPVLQPPRLAGEDQRREALQHLLDAAERGLVGIAGNLPDRQAAPAHGGPFLAHGLVLRRRARRFAGVSIEYTSWVGGR